MRQRGTVEDLIRGINTRNEVSKFEIDNSNLSYTKIKLNLKFPFNLPILRHIKCKEIESYLNSKHSTIAHLITVN